MPKKRAAPVDNVVKEPATKRRSARSPEPKAVERKPKSKTAIVKKTPKETPIETSKSQKAKPQKSAPAKAAPKAEDERKEGEIRYWLMKAEPETRIENGVDVRFSIDDLASKKVPEPWDGIRNHVAKNNQLAMRKGDLAFFYHSNCKVPGIVGIMEVVGEAIPDKSAWDPKSPYYDPKSSPDKPRWFCPLVEFRQKFKEIVPLEQLKQETPLTNMQVVRLSRLSVSKVTKKEWDYIMSLAAKK